MDELFYLASPYTRYPAGHSAAYRLACGEAAILIKAGFAIYSPIAHSHPIAMYGGLDKLDWELWMTQCRAMLPRVTGLIALRAPGWMHSKGMLEEIATVEELGKPVIYMRMGEVPPALLKRRAEGAPS